MKYGRYRINKILGKGSMGVVYLAHDPQIDRSVALKVLREDRLTSADFVNRFMLEARAIGRLSHPGIVLVYDVGEDQGSIYIAMEFVEGEPLSDLLQRAGLDFERTIDIGIQVAEILDYAHARGIVHRDVKPSNLMLKPDGTIKITDFGIAHMDDPSAGQRTQDGEILGTPAYMSPEQVMGQPVDGRSDLFSLGVILYELSTGERPFKGQSIGTILRSITEEIPIEPLKLHPFISKDLSRIIMKCLSKRPEKRFSTGSDLAEALKTCRVKRGVGKGSETPLEKGRLRGFWAAFFLLAFLGAVVVGIYHYKFIGIPAKGTVNLETTPPGAKVYVDGRLVGNAPLDLSLPIGKHEMRVDLEGYYDWAAQVLFKRGKKNLQVKLLPEK